jgi:hypothetical protein
VCHRVSQFKRKHAVEQVKEAITNLHKLHVIHAIKLIARQDQNVLYRFMLIIVLERYTQHPEHHINNPNIQV